MYAKTLAKSVVKRQAQRNEITVVDQAELHTGCERPSSQDKVEQEPTQGGEAEGTAEDAETSLWCGEDEEEAALQETETPKDSEASDEDEGEDEDPIIPLKHRRSRPAARRVISDSEEDEDENEARPERANQAVQPLFKLPAREVTSAHIGNRLPNLTSLRPPHRKGHSTISNWAQEVVDLTSSPEPPASFVLPPPTRVRTASFAASRPTSSSSNGPLAILTYSPTPTKQRSPCKAPPISRPSTPPLAPSSPSKLVSPSKKKPTIPKAAHLDARPSLDAFWNPTEVNEWNEQHSPAKALVSPKKQKWREDIVKMMEGVALEDSSDEGYESPITSPKKKQPASRSPIKKPSLQETATPSVKELRAQRKAFAERKHALAEAFLLELDTAISSGRVTSLSASTGGIKLIWSKTLKTTAGRANWRREQIRMRTGPLPTDTSTEIRHHCSIELAEKVIDDEDRLYNVLAHEFCHLTTFMISEVRNNPHGAEFKSWGRKATAAFANKGVQVTTKHSYQIEYKYVWECVLCGYEFKRHSKSVDPARHSCGRCKGKLVQTKPTPRGVGLGKEGKREKSEYQVFVKANFSRVKKELEARGAEVQMGKIMEAVAREYREMKARNGNAEKVVIDVDALDEVELALEGLNI
jgi:predicted SprT family Zn-dependent metalloprotease